MYVWRRRYKPVDVSGLPTRVEIAQQADDVIRLVWREYRGAHFKAACVFRIADVDVGAVPSSCAEIHIARTLLGKRRCPDDAGLADSLLEQPNGLARLEAGDLA